MKNKKIGVLVFVLAIVLGACMSTMFSGGVPSVSRKSGSTIRANLQQLKEIDRLYTGTYLIPLQDFALGHLKRQLIPGYKTLTGDDGKPVIKGYCSKKFEVTVGYDNLMQILENQGYIDAARKGNLTALPAPQILASNCLSTRTQGTYDSGGLCYEWDHDRKKRERELTRSMEEEALWQKAVQHGQKSLACFLSAFYN